MSNTPRRRPGGPLASRPLHFIWILDRSGSMKGAKIQTLNTAIREAIPHMRKEAEGNPNAQLLVRALVFSTGVQWHIAQPVPVAEFKWPDITAEGETQMGLALRTVAEQLKMPPMDRRALPPVLVLLSDGHPTDDFASGLKALLDEPWGKHAIRLAIAIGKDASIEPLEKFIAHPELKPMEATNPEALVRYIRWCSTAVVKSASTPIAQSSMRPGAGVPIPAPPDSRSGPIPSDPVW